MLVFCLVGSFKTHLCTNFKDWKISHKNLDFLDCWRNPAILETLDLRSPWQTSVELRSSYPLSLGKHAPVCHNPHYSFSYAWHWGSTQFQLVNILKASFSTHLYYTLCAYDQVSLWPLRELYKEFSYLLFHLIRTTIIWRRQYLFSLFYQLESWPSEKLRLNERSMILT